MTGARPGFYRRTTRRRGSRGLRVGLWLAILGLAVVGYVLLGGQTGLLAVRGEARAVGELQQRVDEVRDGTESLMRATEELGEPESFMLEKVAREQYLMTRPGERVLHVLEQAEQQNEEETSAKDSGR